MSKHINLDREVTRCKDCQLQKDCKIKDPLSGKCPLKKIRDNFDALLEDPEECDL